MLCSVRSMDVKELLYEQINEMGTDNILQKLSESRENSITIIDELIRNCYTNKHGILIDSTACLTLAESLMHYFLTTMMLPSQRKITIKNVELSLIIPDARNLKKHLEQVLFIQFVSSEYNETQKIVNSITSLQPFPQNVWVVSYLPIILPNNAVNYCISNLGRSNSNIHQFSRIMVDIGTFLDTIKDFPFKVF